MKRGLMADHGTAFGFDDAESRDSLVATLAPTSRASNGNVSVGHSAGTHSMPQATTAGCVGSLNRSSD